MTVSTLYITDTADDGVEVLGTWDNNGGAPGDTAGHISIGRYSGVTSYTGLRFTTTLPALLPISSAVLSIYSPGGAAAQTNLPTLIFNGEDADNSAALSGQLPSLRTLTTATESFPIASQQFETAGWNTFDVTSIVQEILNRASFSSHITLIGYNPDGNQGGTAKVLFEDYAKSGGHPAELAITYSSDPLILAGPSSFQDSDVSLTFTGLQLNLITSVALIHGTVAVSSTQVISAQSATSITIGTIIGNVPYGDRFIRFYVNAAYTDYPITLLPEDGNGYVVTVDPLTDPSSCLHQLTPTAIDGCVIEYQEALQSPQSPSGHWVVTDAGRISRPSGETDATFSYRVWHPTPKTWSAFGIITISDEVPVQGTIPKIAYHYNIRMR